MKNINRYLNILFALAIAASAYTLIRVYLSRRNLPPGVCPIQQFNVEIGISITLCVTYVLLSFILPKLKK